MNRTLSVHLSLFMVSLLYAATFSFAKEVMPLYIKPQGFILLRVSTAAILFLLVQLAFVREPLQNRKDLLPLLICALFGVAFNMLLFFAGLAETTPINGAVLMTCTPIFVVIFAWAIYGEPMGWVKLLGIALAAMGAVLLLAGKGLNFSSATLRGDLMVTANAIIYSFYLVYARQLMTRYNPITVSTWTFFFGTLVVSPFGWTQLQEVGWNDIPGYIWGYIAFVLIGSTFLTYLLNAYALRYGTASLVGSYIYLQPALATLIAVAWGKDHLTLEKTLFTLLIFIGVYLVSKKRLPGLVTQTK